MMKSQVAFGDKVWTYEQSPNDVAQQRVRFTAITHTEFCTRHVTIDFGTGGFCTGGTLTGVPDSGVGSIWLSFDELAFLKEQAERLVAAATGRTVNDD